MDLDGSRITLNTFLLMLCFCGSVVSSSGATLNLRAVKTKEMKRLREEDEEVVRSEPFPLHFSLGVASLAWLRPRLKEC